MSQTFAQISDPHLSSLAAVRWRDLCNKRILGYLSWLRKRRFEHRVEVLDSLRRDLRGCALDQLLVTGDLTHIGLPQEFREARDWLQSLGDPRQVAVVPGNHDAYVAADWDETFALWRDYMASDSGPAETGSMFPSLRERGVIAFIGISTACPKPPLLATGTAGADQLERLPGLLAEAARKQQFRVIYLHHSPVPGDERWRKRLTDAPALRDLIVEHGAELVLHGHGHRAGLAELQTCHGAVPVVAVPSASALGLHGREPARYNRYRVAGSNGNWTLQIESRRYAGDSAKFIAADSTAMDVSRRY